MNFLFHMLLSGANDQILIGNFMEDFVKGPLGERFPERIRLGVALHRRIDSFAGRAELFQRSRMCAATPRILFQLKPDKFLHYPFRVTLLPFL